MPLPPRPTTRQALLEAGATPRMLRTQVAAGRLAVVRRGVLLSADRWPDDPAQQHVLRARAEVTVHPDAVISHQSAATIWGLPTTNPGNWWEAPPSITLPPEHHRSQMRSVTHHHRGVLEAGEVQTDDEGYPVTSPARTAVDLALDEELPGALVLLDAAARIIIGSMVTNPRRQHYGAPRLVEEARHLVRRSAAIRRGGSRLVTAIDAIDALRESPGESLSAGHMILAGLPRPECQKEIRTPAGRFHPNFYWRGPAHRNGPGLVGECDGTIKYRDPAAYAAEKRREQVLRDLGYDVVRWQVSEIMHKPHIVMDRIARALGL
ncbi:MAG: hypothetical protein QM708_11780 [Propioniciclava sp.]|uniref:hypothetical protein n=1 Tax=Propioniciclava sp. TaxID=2038686 RepID=UPI0039E2CF50